MLAVDVKRIINKIKLATFYREGECFWEFEPVDWWHLGSNLDNAPIARFRFCYYESDTETGVSEVQRARWWYVEDTMDEEAIVRTAWMALGVSDEHRRREAFKYDGRMVFNPHAKLIS